MTVIVSFMCSSVALYLINLLGPVFDAVHDGDYFLSGFTIFARIVYGMMTVATAALLCAACYFASMF